eukprot:4496728-Amphidinium_carterae.1
MLILIQVTFVRSCFAVALESACFEWLQAHVDNCCYFFTCKLDKGGVRNLAPCIAYRPNNQARTERLQS